MSAFRCAILIKLIALVGSPVWAHHFSSAEFDVTKLIILKGTVKKIEWINPHAWLHLDVKDAEGNITTWRIEGASMNAYENRDFPKKLVTQGIELSITAYPAKNGEPTADGATITFKDGKRIFFGGSAPVDGRDDDGKPCIFGYAGCR